MGLVDLILSQLYAAPVFYTLLLVLLTSIYLLKLKLTPHGINPFATDTRQERRPINFDLSTADRIIKQGELFNKSNKKLRIIEGRVVILKVKMGKNYCLKGIQAPPASVHPQWRGYLSYQLTTSFFNLLLTLMRCGSLDLGR